MWTPGHIDFCGNGTADRAAKEALNKEPADGLLPFSDLNPLPNIYTKFGRKNGMDLLEYPVSFMRFYQSFQTNFYCFVIQRKNTLEEFCGFMTFVQNKSEMD